MIGILIRIKYSAFEFFYLFCDDLSESIKLGMVASLNDVVKKNSVKQIIESHPKYATEAIQQLRNSGIEVDRWWDS
jgi:hypothetical protein